MLGLCTDKLKNMTFRQKILKLVNVPVQRIAFRKDKWGEMATVYFHGKARPISISDDGLSKDEIKGFKHDVKNGSDLMVESALATYGKDWRKYIKSRG